MRIAVMFDNLGPYHIARLASAARQCDLMALEIRATSSEYQWNATEKVAFSRHTLFRNGTPAAPPFGELCAHIESALRSHRTEALAIPGWSGSAAIAGLIVASRLGIPTVVMSESQEIDFDRTPLREFVKRRYLALCRTALVGGTPQRDYLVKLGMPPRRVRIGYDVVDNDYFAFQSSETRKHQFDLRKKYGLSNRFFLASSRFIPKKNLESLIRAFYEYRRRATREAADQGACWDLVIIGDGTLRPDLETVVKQLGLTGVVHLPGFKQYAELPEFYGLADTFVHASTSEQWGLVVNEAMASGLPVLVSERCGCARDLVKPGRNGFTFDPEDEVELARLLEVMSAHDLDRAAMGEESRRIIAGWAPDSFGENLLASAEEARSLGPPRIGIADRMLLEVLARHSERLKSDGGVADTRARRAAAGASNAVRDFFDSQTESYAGNFYELKRGGNYRFGRRLQVACEYCRAIGGSLLDCAMGSGEITAEVLRSGKFSRADLVDISHNMLARGREKIQGLNLEVSCNYIEDDIFQFARAACSMGRKYDVILCLGLIAHVGRLEELLALLRPLLVERTGRLILQSTVTDHPGVRLVRLLTSHRYESAKKYAISYFSRSEIREAAAECGFEVFDETRFGLMVPFGDRLWPWANFHAERLLDGFGRRMGGEAIFALRAV